MLFSRCLLVFGSISPCSRAIASIRFLSRGGKRGFGFAEQARFGLFGDAEDVQAVGSGVKLRRKDVEEAVVFGLGQPAVEEGLLPAGGVTLEDAAHARLGAGVGDVVGDEVGGAVRHGGFRLWPGLMLWRRARLVRFGNFVGGML